MPKKKSKKKSTDDSPIALTSNGIDKKWKEESDARTLAEAEMIKSDKGRIAGASRGARRMVKEQTDALRGLKKVAKKGRN